jgi:AcrR family transcriptional regulator
MARIRFENLAPSQRERILAAAADEFAERGYVGASVARVAAGAGISKGMLYYYFTDKDDLFATVVELTRERLAEAGGAIKIEELSPSSFWDALRDARLRAVTVRGRDAWHVRLGLAFPRLREEPEAAAAVGRALEWRRRFTERYIQRGQELGTVRQDLPQDLLVDVALALDEAADRWFSQHHHRYQPERLARLVDARIDMLRDMLDSAHEGWDV